MVFNSLEFAAFFPLVWFAYWRLRHRGQNALLLMASWFFYAMFDWRFLGLMLLSTVTDFVVGRLLKANDADDGKRRRIFALSLLVNLGILGYFKYADFFVDSAADLLDRLGIAWSAPVLRVALPVGISFYTFHGISYTFDVYRRIIEPARDFLSFAVFVAYFPQLVSGPIGRATIQLPQFENPRAFPDSDKILSAAFLILLGLFQKIAVADALAPHVNRAFADASTASWVTAAVGAIGFALQIYGDFAGYSNIARGTSRLLGVELPLNFAQPYLSRNITEFWRRWHISLSTWLRDYLYVPLGGNRGSRRRTYRNLMIVMLLGGLWHGASMTFVVWGGLHGLALAAHRGWTERAGAARMLPSAELRVADLPRIVATAGFAVGAFVVFRATTFGNALDMFEAIVTFRGGDIDGNAVAVLLLAVLALIGIDLAQRMLATRQPVSGWRPSVQGVAAGALVLPILVFSGGAPVPFIYFQF
ncbi:MAG: MBOAT family O-acyltransferase [Acidimicrobiales bacterium]